MKKLATLLLIAIGCSTTQSPPTWPTDPTAISNPWQVPSTVGPQFGASLLCPPDSYGIYGLRSGIRTGVCKSLGGFNPKTSVRSATLKLWLDARLGVTIVTGVSSWVDQSGNGNTFTQGTGANQPAFNATGVNGFPGVASNAFGKNLTLAGSVLAQNAARTYYFAMTSGTNTGQPLYAPRGGQGYCVVYCTQAGPSIIETNQVDTNNQIPGATIGGVAAVVSWYFDGITTHVPVFKINGVAQAVTNGVGTGVGSEGATNTEALFGAGTTNGTIGTFLVYSGVVSAGEDAQILTYLKARYNL